MTSHLAFKFKTKYDRQKLSSTHDAIVEKEEDDGESLLMERMVVKSRYLETRPKKKLDPDEFEHRDYLMQRAQEERETLRKALQRTFDESVARGETFAVLKSLGRVPKVRKFNRSLRKGKEAINPEVEYCSPGNPEDEDLVGEDISEFESRLEIHGAEWAKTPMKTGIRAKATQKTFGSK